MATTNRDQQPRPPEDLENILNGAAHGTINPAGLESLRASAIRIQEFRELNLEVITYPGPGYHSNDNRQVYVNTRRMNYAMPVKQVCVCHRDRSPLECCCHPSQCPKCQVELIAVNMECEFDNSCLDDACPMCSHYREVCHRQEFLDRIKEHAQEAITEGTEEEWADAYLSAIGAFFGHTLPKFPLVEALLDEVATRSPDPEETSGPARSAPATWTFQEDGSTISETTNRLYVN